MSRTTVQERFKTTASTFDTLWGTSGIAVNISPIAEDELWSQLYDYINVRISLQVGAREELQRKLASERKRRIASRARVKDR